MKPYKYRQRIIKSQEGSSTSGWKNYSDWNNLSPEEKEWIIQETARINFGEGKGADRDSLIHIVDNSRMKNPFKDYDSSVARDLAGKNLLSGLNKTVGTSLTGAALATMGAWNVARLLGIGKGTPFRLWTAENALAGARGGAVADVSNYLEDPTMYNFLQVLLNRVGSKDLLKPSTKAIITTGSALDVNDIRNDL